MAFIAPLIGLPASIGTAAGIGASMLAATGSLMQGAATQQAMQYNAQVAKTQAITATNQAASQYASTVSATRQKIGQAIAAGGSGGFNETSGSFRDYLTMTGTHGYMAGLNQVYSGEVAATGYRNQATADIYAGNAAMTGGYIGAGSNLLGGVANMYRFPGTTTNLGYGSGN